MAELVQIEVLRANGDRQTGYAQYENGRWSSITNDTGGPLVLEPQDSLIFDIPPGPLSDLLRADHLGGLSIPSPPDIPPRRRWWRRG